MIDGSMDRFALRPYQRDAVQELLEALRAGKRPLYVLPTGGGKTAVAARVAFAESLYGKRIHFWVHRVELIDQAVSTLQGFLPGEPISIIHKRQPLDENALIAVAMVQSLANRVKVDDIPKPDIVFVDEAHHAPAPVWATLLKWCPDAQVVGLTATPIRLDGKGLDEHFDTMILGPGDAALTEEGYLSPVDLLVPSMAEVIGSRKRRETVTVGDPVRTYQRYAEGRRAIFFGWTVQHSQNTALALRAVGIRVAHIDGKTSGAIRESVLARLRSGDLDVVCNYNIISEGVDVPDCDCIILGAPTASLAFYLQRCGRGRRPGVGKRTLILDLVGSVYHFGPPNLEREWTLEGGAAEQSKRVLPFDPQDRGRDAHRPIETVDWELVPYVLKNGKSWEHDELISTKAVAAITGLKTRAIHARRHAGGDMPQPVAAGGSGGALYWQKSEILRWNADRREERIATRDVCKVVHTTRSSLETMVEAGIFPTPALGPGKVLKWRRSEVDAWRHEHLIGWDELEREIGKSIAASSRQRWLNNGKLPKPIFWLKNSNGPIWSRSHVRAHVRAFVAAERESVDLEEVLSLCGVTSITVLRWRQKRNFPAPLKRRGLNGRLLWRRQAILDWMQAQDSPAPHPPPQETKEIHRTPTMTP